jgi:hypothetical protein
VETWKSRLEKNIDSYLPQELKSQSLSLVPLHQNVDPMNTQKLSAAPSIPDTVQKP